ncbi:MAG: dihydrolipoamide acetyltransferase family protein [Anaerolineales bacterium]
MKRSRSTLDPPRYTEIHMAEVVPMPKLGFDMAEGTLVKIIKKEGETVAKGEIIADIETDKATIEVEAYLGGVVNSWLVAEGAVVPVGTPMVIIAEPGEKVDLAALGVGADSKSATAPTPAPQPASAGQPAPAAIQADSESAIAPESESAGRVTASPIARRMLDDAGVDARLVTGTGPSGRITKKDVEVYLAAPKTAQAPKAAAAAPKPASAPQPIIVAQEDEAVPLTKLRAIIARRMAESTSTVPAIYLTIEVDMAAAMSLRKQVNGLLSETGKVSVNDFVIKAAALALRQLPNLNASWGGDKVVRKGAINVANAVATENGLLTVVVKQADQKPVAQIGAEMKAMAGRAREGKVHPADIEGSTFTVSNLGMYDIEHFTAIINLPEAAILAVGAVKEVPVVKDGALTPGMRMKMTCAADHRVTDGAEVAQFLQAIKKQLEEPLRLLV